MRVNARLDEAYSQKLEFLTRVTSESVSDVLKRAIDLYYRKVKRDRPSSAELLEREGFVGCGDGPLDLSQTYKERQREVLAGKHDHR